MGYLTKISAPHLELHQPFRHIRLVIFASQKAHFGAGTPFPTVPATETGYSEASVNAVYSPYAGERICYGHVSLWL